MKFRAEHTFASLSLKAFEQLFFDEPFNEAMCQDVAIERRLLKRQLSDGHLSRQVMVHPERQIPGPIAKLTGGQKIGYTEDLDYVFGSFAGTFSCTPTVMAERVLTAGTFRFEARGNDVVRIVEGDVTVKVFGVGKIIERFIVTDVERSYEDAARFTAQYLARTPS